MQRKSRLLKVGHVTMGGGTPVVVQSMLNAPPHDIRANLEQTQRLAAVGCQIIRVAMPDRETAQTVYALKNAAIMPVVADIHFDYHLALEAIAAGADKIRINPGNIGDKSRLKAVADACRQKGIPIRVGINSGSLEKELLAKYGGPTAEALAESGLASCRLLENLDFSDIVLSVKASDLKTAVDATRIVASACHYPLHLGITEAGSERMGVITSSIGLGALLMDGIGDTIRVSLSAAPEREVEAAYDILTALGLTQRARVISCPTCGRTKGNVIELAKKMETLCRSIPRNIRVAVMGCEVNGPGEAKDADIGIAFGKDSAMLFKSGMMIQKLPLLSTDELASILIEEIGKL